MGVNRNTMKILLEAPILTQSGYGTHSRLVFDSLRGKGLDIYVSALEWGKTSWNIDLLTDQELRSSIIKYGSYMEACRQENKQPQFDVQIRVGIANEFEKKAKYSVLVTAGIETDRVSAEWLMRTHRGIDKIVVPSNHAKLGFSETYYEVSNNMTQQKTHLACASDIDVVPYPVVDHDSVEVDLDIDTKFNFLSIALLGHRKNIENSIIWFLEEFRDDPDVGLIIKTGMGKNSLLDRESTRKMLRSVRSAHKDSKCKVYLLHGSMSNDEIHSLINHEKVHAYYSTTHGEGYGLPIFEAAYSGLPVIVTDWSAHLDFMSAPFKESGKIRDKKLFAKIDYDLREVDEHAVWEPLIIKGSKWAYPRASSAKHQLRKMYKNYGMYKKWASVLKEQILKTHNRDLIINKMFESLIPESMRSLPSQEQVDSEIESMFSSLSG